MSSQSRAFFHSLESLRGIAALLVVIYHVGWLNPLYEFGFVRNGALMVDLFFVLSGFVMVHCYQRKLNTRPDFFLFLKLRFWRLYPLHLVMLFVFLGIEFIKYFGELYWGITASLPAFSNSDSESFIYHLFLLHSLMQDHGSYNSPSWSISTEFYIYILFAFLMVFTKTERNRSILFLCGAVFSVVIILNLGHTSLTFDYKDSIFRCAYGFFIGAFTHGIYYRLKNTLLMQNTQLLNLILLFFIMPCFLYITMIKHDNYIEFLMPLMTSILILYLTLSGNSFLNKLLSQRVFLWLGKISYSMYMVHMALIWIFSAALQVLFKAPKMQLDNGELVITMTNIFGGAVLLLFLACVFYISHLSYKYIEEPCRNFAKKRVTLPIVR